MGVFYSNLYRSQLVKAKTWPERISNLRAKLKLNQDEFADLIGFKTRGAVSLLESGERVPTDTLKRLIAAIEKNPNNFPIRC